MRKERFFYASINTCHAAYEIRERENTIAFGRGVYASVEKRIAVQRSLLAIFIVAFRHKYQRIILREFVEHRPFELSRS